MKKWLLFFGVFVLMSGCATQHEARSPDFNEFKITAKQTKPTFIRLETVENVRKTCRHRPSLYKNGVEQVSCYYWDEIKNDKGESQHVCVIVVQKETTHQIIGNEARACFNDQIKISND
jgi:hypothetical protein